MDIEKYNDRFFSFAEEFTCSISGGVVYIEQYGEGRFPLTHIKTERQLILLYEILTGYKWIKF